MGEGGISNRGLWQFLTGSTLTKPKKLVGEEIGKYSSRLKEGLQFYPSPRCPAGEKLKKEPKQDVKVVEFVKKLSIFLALDELYSLDVYNLYVQHEYRGSPTDLQTSLTTDPQSQLLLYKVRDYYYTERLYLLRNIKHILSYWQTESHPYQAEYYNLVKQLYSSDSFQKHIHEQYDQICQEIAPTWETRGKGMTERHTQIWAAQNVKEQSELLEILVLYYSSAQHRPDHLLLVATTFKKYSFGRRQTNRHLLQEQAEHLLNHIGFLQVVLIVQGLDLEDLMVNAASDSTKLHHVLSSSKFENMDQYFESLGQIPEHGALLLAWASLRELGDKHDDVKTASLGNRALGVKVFSYIISRLQSETFSKKSVISKLCHSLVYGLLCAVLTAFHQDTLGDKEPLQKLASVLLKQAGPAEHFWKNGMDDGLGPLFQAACRFFPLDFSALSELCTSLAQASADSSHQVSRILQKLPVFTDIMTYASNVKATSQPGVWQLLRDHRPYQNYGVDVVIPSGSYGEYRQLASAGIVHWEVLYDTWEVFLAEAQILLQQVGHSSGMVQEGNVQRVTEVCQLAHALLLSDAPHILNSVPQLDAITGLLFQVVSRFCQVQPPPVELLASSVSVIHQMALFNPIETFHKLQQTGLIPHLTENIDNFSELVSGRGLNAGAYGTILAGTECPHGRYPLTIAMLDFTTAMVLPLSQENKADVLLPTVVIILREIFTGFSKWRYYNLSHRETIGHKCLEIFHRVLNVSEKKSVQQRISVQNACVYSLLHTEAGQALLDIVSTSVDTIDASLATQGNAMEGMGIELIQLIRLAFSVLNRLLLLRTPGAPPSPVEHSLSAQTSSLLGSKRNTMSTIAQYIYHRHDPRLATLATVLLRRLSMIFPMSVLACLGDESERIRDVFLSRLKAENEDIRLKVVILELLSTCVDTQPGLIEIFLDVRIKQQTSSNVTANQTTKGKKSEQEVVVRPGSCLHTVLSLIENDKQVTYKCPSQLLCAAIEFIHALWHGQRETAMIALREKHGFWHSVCLSLTRELQAPRDADTDFNVLQKEILSCANIMKILALELYNNRGSQMDENLKNVLTEILGSTKMLYWSKYLLASQQWASMLEDLSVAELSDNATLQLLYAWRNLLLVLHLQGSKGIKALSIPDSVKETILSDLLQGIMCQFSAEREVTSLNIKLASVTSAFYLTLLHHWLSHLEDWPTLLKQLEAILSQTMSSCETLIPSVQIGLLGALTLILQHLQANNISGDDISRQLASITKVTCSLVQQSTYQLPTPLPTPASEHHPHTRPSHSTTLPHHGNTTLGSSLHSTSAMTQQNQTASQNWSILGNSLPNSTGIFNESQMAHKSGMAGQLGSDGNHDNKEGSEGTKPVDLKCDEKEKDIEVKLKLQTAGLCLLQQLIDSQPSPEFWLPELQQFSILQTVLDSVDTWIQAHQGAEYAQSVVTLLLTVSKHPQGAECVSAGSFIQQLCLVLSSVYSQADTVTQTGSTPKPAHTKGTQNGAAPTWMSIYCLSITLYSSLLSCLRYNFLSHALEFVGVHQDRMYHCLSTAGVALQEDILQEAEVTCRFISKLSVYRREWRLQLPQVLQRLMGDVCLVLQRSISLLIRPSLLQHMLEKQKCGQEPLQVISQDKLIASPFIRSMSQQPADDSDHHSQDVLNIQNRFLVIVSQCLIALREFSPDLCEIISDQSLDVGEYDAFLQIGFSTPPVDQDSNPTFGTLISCISLCIFLLNKVDGRGPSGTLSAKQEHEKMPIERSLVMFVMENTLYLIMSQALRGLKDPELSSRDKQLLKRELSAELNSFLAGMQRYMRRGATGAQTPSSSSSLTNAASFSEANFLKLLDVFVRKVLR